ncbi:MAG TPA: hypothetical protein VIX63_11750, partial [Vicinamibacterales bacterium]
AFSVRVQVHGSVRGSKFSVQFAVRRSGFGVRGSRERRRRDAPNNELRTENRELNSEPEHEPGSENPEE